MKVLVIIPTLNSFETILDVIAGIEVHAPEVDYIVIDRGSTDRTLPYIKNNEVNHLICPITISYHKAVSLGLKYAYQNNYDAVIEFDDKGRYQPEDIPYFIETYKNSKVDMVMGTRYLHTKSKGLSSKWLKLTSRGKMTDARLDYMLYGVKAMKHFANKKNFNEPTPDRLFHLIRSGYKYKEINIKLKKDGKRGETRSGISEFVNDLGYGLSMMFVQPLRRKKGGR